MERNWVRDSTYGLRLSSASLGHTLLVLGGHAVGKKVLYTIACVPIIKLAKSLPRVLLLIRSNLGSESIGQMALRRYMSQEMGHVRKGRLLRTKQAL